ncbi:hypothetical protein N7455_003961 [Penicillium solitum]|uniref:uncharacterized protein n=1 Tax=Penicillium solitum TaxID=60172 RepID=UPI0032C428DA|nr:hypothetical protein N7455_003961 [Penicillium solitum]
MSPTGAMPALPSSLKDIVLGQLETWSSLFGSLLQQGSLLSQLRNRPSHITPALTTYYRMDSPRFPAMHHIGGRGSGGVSAVFGVVKVDLYAGDRISPRYLHNRGQLQASYCPS